MTSEVIVTATKQPSFGLWKVMLLLVNYRTNDAALKKRIYPRWGKPCQYCSLADVNTYASKKYKMPKSTRGQVMYVCS